MDDVSVIIRPDLETVLTEVLGVVQKRLNGGAIRLVAHVDCKAV